MQVITSSGSGDVKGGGKIPDWDKVKNVYKKLCEALGRAPRRDEDVASIIGKAAFKIIQDSISVKDANNANKYIAAAKLGSEFMTMYEIANNMHMQCKFFHFGFDFLVGNEKLK